MLGKWLEIPQRDPWKPVKVGSWCRSFGEDRSGFVDSKWSKQLWRTFLDSYHHMWAIAVPRSVQGTP